MKCTEREQGEAAALADARLKADRWFARRRYEELVLLQPHVHTDGLWWDQGGFAILCPQLKDEHAADDGRPLVEWFQSTRSVGPQVDLVSSVSDMAVRVPERSIEELAIGVGEPRNNRDSLVDLSLALPHDFPEFSFSTDASTATVLVARQLTEEQQQRLEEAYARLTLWKTLTVTVDPSFATTRGRFHRKQGDGDIDLVPSRLLSTKYAGALRVALEDDEDFWSDRRSEIFSTEKTKTSSLLPARFRKKLSRCLVNAAVVQPKNIRTYVPLYRDVVFVAPLDSNYCAMLAGLGATEDELVRLAASGRISFLLPQSLERYPASLVNRLATDAPTSLLFSRRLGAAAVAESRRRISMLYPPFGIDKRREFLAQLSLRSDPISRALLSELGRIWLTAENAVHREGAMATAALGAGALIGAVGKGVTGRDLWLEAVFAGGDVEWAAVLYATVFPTETDGYSQQRMTEALASVYSGVPNSEISTSFGDVGAALEEILLFENDAPIDDVVAAFQGSDVDRLRSLVTGMADEFPDAVSRANAVRDFNERVRRYERRSDRWTKMDLLTAAGIAASTGEPVISFAGWLAHRALLFSDTARAAVTWSSRDVVLVSRLRKKLAS